MTAVRPKRTFVFAAVSCALVAGAVLLAAWSQRDVASAGHEPSTVDMVNGGNLVTYGGPTLPVDAALNDIREWVNVIWSFDNVGQAWLLWSPLLPSALQGFTDLEHGRPYFIFVQSDRTWSFPPAGAAGLPSSPPAVRLLVGDQIHEPERGSYCWPADLVQGIGLCADSPPFFPAVDSFIPLPDGLVRLRWDQPIPGSVFLNLSTPDQVGTGVSTTFDTGGPDLTWTPTIDPGDYILSVFAAWGDLGGAAANGVPLTGDALYFFPVTIPASGDPFPTVSALAPIQSLEVIVAESFPPQYFAHIVSILPDGCAEFDRNDVTREDTTIRIDVWNLVPAPEAEIACIDIFRTVEHNVPLGTDFVSGTEYTVIVNDVSRTFVAQ